MMKMLLILPVLMAAYGCRKAYSPKAITAAANYLVVEGTINTGQDSTIFKLSRTARINASTTNIPENGAGVTVEGAGNVSYPLTELSTGRYSSAALGLDSTQQYRVRIKTADGKEYISDMVQSKATPAIDSIGFNMVAGNGKTGIQVYVNTHDPKNNTHYYRWDYQETWQFHAMYNSAFISDGQFQINPRTLAQKIYSCFSDHASTNVTVGSSAKLQQDLIYQQPVTFIESTSEKIETRYSILLKQYALTQDAFNYWQNLEKNTEQLGSIFDAQPSELQGNIHCLTNRSEPVVGYVSAGSVKEKRVYIDHSQLPESWVANYPYSCRLDSQLFCAGRFCTNEVALYLVPQPNALVPVSALFREGIGIGFMASTKGCVDCTLRGTTRAPAFWKY